MSRANTSWCTSQGHTVLQGWLGSQARIQSSIPCTRITPLLLTELFYVFWVWKSRSLGSWGVSKIQL